jgi:hypothetical protein
VRPALDAQPALPCPVGQRLRRRALRGRPGAQRQIPAGHPETVLAQPGPRLVDQPGLAVQHRNLDAGCEQAIGDASLPLRRVHARVAGDEDRSHASRASYSMSESARNFVAQFGYWSGA